MILDSLENEHRYRDLHPLFANAFDYLRRTDLAKLPLGRHTLDEDRLFVILSNDPGRGRDQVRLESHRRYIDIQYIVEGVDEIGWRTRSQCLLVASPFDAEKDIGFYTDVPSCWISVPAGSFVVFWPEDAHAPLADPSVVRKAIVKIAVNP